MELKIGQIYKVKRSDYPGEVFLYEKTSGDSRLLAVSVFKNQDPKIVRSVLNTLNHSFFGDYPVPLQSTAMAERLAGVNLNFSKLKVPKNEMSATLIEINGRVIHVASRGNTGVWLIRDGDFEHINSGDTDESPELFSNFASGEISEGDSLLITSKSLFNFISIKQIVEIISKHGAQEACNEILKIIKPLVAADEGVVAFLINAGNRKRVGKFKLPALNFRITKKSLVLVSALLFLAFTVYMVGKTISGARNLSFARAEYLKLERIDDALNQGESAFIYENYDRLEEALTQARQQLNSVDAEKLSIDGQKEWLELEKRYTDLKQNFDKKR